MQRTQDAQEMHPKCSGRSARASRCRCYQYNDHTERGRTKSTPGEVVTKWKQGGTVPELIRGEAAGQCTTEGATRKRSERRTVHAAEGSRRDQRGTASRSDPETIRSTHTGKRSECVTITRHIKRGKNRNKRGKKWERAGTGKKNKIVIYALCAQYVKYAL